MYCPQDRQLAMRVLKENDYNAHMAIIELIQILELTGGDKGMYVHNYYAYIRHHYYCC